MFPVYLELGFDHISDLKGYDHILFIIALCAVFSVSDWKKILILVTAFTIGHSLTLALSSLQIINVSEFILNYFPRRLAIPSLYINKNFPYLIELLIPVTILLTAIQNFWFNPDQQKRLHLNYLLALFFGFIHGMGFSNFFRSLLGQEADIVLPLFAFNIGVELGQLCIVGCIMLVDFLVVKVGKVKQQYWNYTVSIVAIILSIMMIIQRV